MGSEPWAKQAKTNSIMCTAHYKTTERQYPEKKNDDSSISKGSIVVELIIMVTPGGSHRCLLSMIRDLSKKDVEYCWKLCKSRVQPIPHSYQYMQWQRTYKKHTCYVRLYLFLVSHRPCQPILSTMWLWLMCFVIGARYSIFFVVTSFCRFFPHVTLWQSQHELCLRASPHADRYWQQETKAFSAMNEAVRQRCISLKGGSYSPR